jgi:hypothetical protein
LSNWTMGTITGDLRTYVGMLKSAFNSYFMFRGTGKTRNVFFIFFRFLGIWARAGAPHVAGPSSPPFVAALRRHPSSPKVVSSQVDRR